MFSRVNILLPISSLSLLQNSTSTSSSKRPRHRNPSQETTPFLHFDIQTLISMDPIKMEKAKAMERYKKIQFIQVLFQYLLTALVLAMAISKAFPPSLFSSVKLFFSVSLPSLGAFIISPKCVFIVCNAIVIFLFSESKLAGTATSSQEIYDEYVLHQRKLQRRSSVEAKEKEKPLDQVRLVEGDEKMIKEGDDEEVKRVLEEETRKEEKRQEEEEDKIEKGDEQLEGAEKVAAEEEEDDEEEEEEKEKEAEGMEADELNRRAEDFIARITKQFKLEAQMLACGG